MKETIAYLESLQQDFAADAAEHRKNKDHIRATQKARIASNLLKITKMARLIFLP
jgi:hypothetical protein